MKYLLNYLFIIACYWNSYSQDNDLFDISEIKITDSIPYSSKPFYAKQQDTFFEDDNYIVSRSCSGEWGGSIWFKNKSTGIVYSCAATCPISINKIDGNYIVTNSLAHLSGFSEVIEIENPQTMEVFVLPKPFKKKGKTIYRYVGDTESKSRKGVNEIWKAYNVLALASFQYKGILYHIIADKDYKTYVSTIENGEMVNIQLISDKRIWDYSPRTFRMPNGNLLIYFKTNDLDGYIEIEDNKINVFEKK